MICNDGYLSTNGGNVWRHSELETRIKSLAGWVSDAIRANFDSSAGVHGRRTRDQANDRTNSTNSTSTMAGPVGSAVHRPLRANPATVPNRPVATAPPT